MMHNERKYYTMLILNLAIIVFLQTKHALLKFVSPPPCQQLRYSIVSGNKAGLLNIARDTGEISLSPALDNNVATTAQMRVAVTGKHRLTIIDYYKCLLRGLLQSAFALSNYKNSNN